MMKNNPQSSSEFSSSPAECSQCGSARIIPDAILGDQGQYSSGEAHVFVYQNPNAFLFKGAITANVVGKLCCDCGHVEFRCVGDLNALWSAYRIAKEET